MNPEIFNIKRELDELYAQEPECNCMQAAVDCDDASYCDLHNEMSSWNREIRALRFRLQCLSTLPVLRCPECKRDLLANRYHMYVCPAHGEYFATECLDATGEPFTEGDHITEDAA